MPFYDLFLFSVDKEDKLNVDNRLVVNNFQAELGQEIGSLCNMVAISMSQQNEHLQCTEKLCNSFLDVHNKVSSKIGHLLLFYHSFVHFTVLLDSGSFLFCLD